MSASGSADVWAVGDELSNVTIRGLAEHWTGAFWSVVQTPRTHAYTYLNGVVDLSPTDAWAVGFTESTSALGVWRALIEHWDGKSWTRFASPVRGALWSVTAFGASDVWASGSGPKGALVEHWDGASWTVQPIVPEAGGVLSGIAGSSSTDIWTVGRNHYRRTLIEHWDGSVWSRVRSPSPGTEANRLLGVTVVAPDDVWAVGYRQDLSHHTTNLIEHWSGLSWWEVSEPMPTSNNVLSRAVPSPAEGSGQ